MPIWKQNLLRRLMGPTDADGGDLGGGAPVRSATEMAIDAIGAIGATQSEPEAGATGDALPAEEATEDAPADGDNASEQAPAEEPATAGESKAASFLDGLTEGSKLSAKPADGEAKPAGGEEKPDADATPTTPEQEEAELLEGVKSERGKERIRQVFAERKRLQADIDEFREIVKSTGMSPEQFAQTLEFGRLVTSNDEKSLRVALEMIEGQRAMLYQKLGVEAPGVDLLAGHDDLKTAVDNMEITRDRAVELAKYRKQQTDATQRQQMERQSQQQRVEYEQQVRQAAGAMGAYLQTRANEVDHPARLKAIIEHFKNPANMQDFVSQYQPSQWAHTVRLMYDSIKVPRSAPVTPTQQPLRSRPAALGVQAPNAGSPMDRMAQHLDAMGL